MDFWVFIFGLCIGSFLNVCIYRLPAGASICDPPRSQCLQCGRPIRFFDNIPLISYLILRGRCRHCQCAISPRYPIVELLSGCFALAVFRQFGLTAEAAFFYVFICALLVVVFIDIDHQIIPDVISLPGIALFFAASFIDRSPIAVLPLAPRGIVAWSQSVSLPPMMFNALIGILIGGGILYLVAWGYYSLTGKEGMGGGDIKLLAMIGAMIGWEGVVFTLFAGSAAGVLAGVALMAGARKRDMKLRIPFGPFLSLGAIVYIFFGSQLIYGYLTLAR